MPTILLQMNLLKEEFKKYKEKEEEIKKKIRKLVFKEIKK